MEATRIERDFTERVCAQVRLESAGPGQYRVVTPFEFDDGDLIGVVLRRNGEGWVLSDEGHTFFHLTDYVDERELLSGDRNAIIDSTLNLFEVEDRDGELITKVNDGDFGSALFSFVQAILRIADVSYLSREQVKSTFADDVRGLVERTVAKGDASFNWHDPVRDPQNYYPVDYRINGRPDPTFLFMLSSPTRAKDAVVTLQQFEIWEVLNRSIGIYDEVAKISERDRGRLAKVCPMTFEGLRKADDIARVLRQDRIV